MREELERRKAEIQASYNELTKNHADIQEELRRLEGEFRVVEDLLKQPIEEVAQATKRIRRKVEVQDAPTEQ